MEIKADQINQEIQSSGVDTNLISDGFHSFGDLYEHRVALTAALFNEWASHYMARQEAAKNGAILPANLILPKHDVHKSRRHTDGELCFGGGWFIVCATLPTGQISYHYSIS